MLTNRFRFSLVTPLVATLLVTAVACSGGKPSDAAGASATPNTDTAASAFMLTAEQRSRIHLLTVAPTTFRPAIQTTGTVAFNGNRSTQVLSPISGPVTRLLVENGAYVARGTPLATVSSPDFAEAIATYRKAVTTAKNLDRIAEQDEQLFKADAIARRDLEQAQTDAAGADADREAALEQLRSIGLDAASVANIQANPGIHDVPAVIRATLDGTVVERLITPGQLLQAGATPAFTIADLSSVWVMANVFESDIAAVHAGESVTITIDSTTPPLTGKVDYVGSIVDSATRATTVRLLVQNHNNLLKRDMFVQVVIDANRSKTGILVPASAVMRDEDNLPYVYLAIGRADSTQRYIRRRVTLGAHVGTQYEITSGVSAGDQVVTDGALFVQFAESQ